MNIIDFLRKRHVDLGSQFDGKSSSGKKIIYINPWNYAFLRKNRGLLQGAHYYVDGMYFRGLLRVFVMGADRIQRQAFDFSSVAGSVFEQIRAAGLRVFVAGGTEEEVGLFCRKIVSRYPGLQICGAVDGFRSASDIVEQVCRARPDVVLLSLGNVKQEIVTADLVGRTDATSITCGAFVSQTARSAATEYYPHWARVLGLRWLYRFVREPRVIGRVIRYYPLAPALIVHDLWRSSRTEGGAASVAGPCGMEEELEPCLDIDATSRES
jgi:exopolysaccharide biosynthesis WecB/TagA/CpsF family protein